MTRRFDISEFSYKSNYTKINNYYIHYIDEGSENKNTLLMLHGNPTWSFMFRKLIAEFKNSFRTIVPDHIGCGLSDKPSPNKYNYCLKTHIDNLENLLNYLNIKNNITLVLHDWGAPIGLGYAIRHPTTINNIIILNSAAFTIPENAKFPLALWLFKYTKLGKILNNYLNIFAITAALTCTYKKMPPNIIRSYLAPYDSPSNREAIIKFVQDIPLTPQDKSYKLILDIEQNLNLFKNTPILMCWGCKDYIFTKPFYQKWLQLLPNIKPVLYKYAGHYILEDAAEEIILEIRKFLKIS